MARILFVWELGNHYGHLLAYQPLIGSLRRDGHQIVFCAKRLDLAQQVYAGGEVELRATPATVPPQVPPCPQANSYAEILLNTLFHDTALARARVAAWCGMLREVDPDLILFDFSPSAMLANRALRYPALVCGNGFMVPTPVAPLPPLRYWESADAARLAASETLLVDRMNAAAAPGSPRLHTVAELFSGMPALLRTFPELDHYPGRRGGRYIGIFPSPEHGQPPDWPGGDGPRVLGYLRPQVAVPALLAALVEAGCRSLIYYPEPPSGWQPAASPHLRLVPAPVKLDAALPQADIVLTNGNLGTTAAALLAGRPVLMAPNTLEKRILARRVEGAGGGLAVSDPAPGPIRVRLQALLSQREYRRAAERFARRHGLLTPQAQVQALRGELAALLPAIGA